MKIYKSKHFKFSANGNDLYVRSLIKEEVMIDSYPFSPRLEIKEISPKPTHKVGQCHGWIVAEHKNVSGRFAFVYALPYDVHRIDNDLYLKRSINFARNDWTWVSETSIIEL